MGHLLAATVATAVAALWLRHALEAHHITGMHPELLTPLFQFGQCQGLALAQEAMHPAHATADHGPKGAQTFAPESSQLLQE
jgi:hypothetical protein